ncbi:sporulation protein [Streptomyces sp. NPDC048172]|uniref:sporulation protein n=1 Tax=Streptomyces sp. NPDC048172 TaxID=3365505 RepID=UPI00371FFBEE
METDRLSVHTVMTPGSTVPGGALTGEVTLVSEGTHRTVDLVALELTADAPARNSTAVLHHLAVGGPFELGAGEPHVVPFAFTVPHGTPFTEWYGQPVGVTVGVRARVRTAGADRTSARVLVSVRPLPAQEAVLTALDRHGFGWSSADLSPVPRNGGHAAPVAQRVEFTPPPRYGPHLDSVAVIFLARDDEHRPCVPGCVPGALDVTHARVPLARAPTLTHHGLTNQR